MSLKRRFVSKYREKKKRNRLGMICGFVFDVYFAAAGFAFVLFERIEIILCCS